jgi:hypothetical protein
MLEGTGKRLAHLARTSFRLRYQPFYINQHEYLKNPSLLVNKRVISLINNQFFQEKRIPTAITANKWLASCYIKKIYSIAKWYNITNSPSIVTHLHTHSTVPKPAFSHVPGLRNDTITILESPPIIFPFESRVSYS